MMSGDEIMRIIREDKQAEEIRKKALQELLSTQPMEIGLEAEILELRSEVDRQRNEYNLFRHTAKTEIERLRAAGKAVLPYIWDDACLDGDTAYQRAMITFRDALNGGAS